ncbi:bifunctional UDP-N-acetylglucosamine diphosphorylase/glucosamine-1-phosphate N-acetyltransferase GlmU [Methylobacillus caricis]|nr:bifunctional UDP-N-acetylglucosamine diphosphorylase/glucosamine-1-phosphate N-acetyltransferase GlmU [Methylobacillus caricis]MCB5189026.1 bifunctional UDP-N-acetylglucosamine diphosphorylase/glucosamine-1-phosphate N-acetyltransferase GlmU [Methylobacillus caricis]
MSSSHASSRLNIVILAAGKGTRMHSSKPKVLHALAGKPILQHVIDAAKSLQPSKIIVIYGFGGEAVPQAISHEDIVWVKQTEQLGTGHAMQQALPYLDHDARTLILLGDVPLLSAQTCQQLLTQPHPLALLTVIKGNPNGYGRIVRAGGQVRAIVEHKDANEQQRTIREVNTGIMAAENRLLAQWLQRLNNDNAQKEYYLTDIVAMAVEDGEQVTAVAGDDEWQVAGVNSKQDLAALERVYQHRYAGHLLAQGVTLADPARIDVRGELNVGSDVEIDVGCVFEGKITLADNVRIGPYCVIRNASIGAGTVIAAYTHIEDAQLAESCKIGPYARLRPGTVLANDTHIGNFVELKNAQVDVGSKINHLSYVGDTTVGKKVNIGAGTITCNYDGVNKFRTIIEDHAFIGSDSQLVAPITIGAGATIAAGSTITQDAPADKLTMSRGKQFTIEHWKRPEKVKK